MGILDWRRHRAWIVPILLGMAAAQAAAAASWTVLDLGTLGGAGSYGAAVSNNGIVAGCSDVASGEVHAFIYRDGVMRDLGGAGGNSCALAVNDAGVAAGRAATGELVIWDGASVAPLGIAGDIGAINDAGVVVGTHVDAGRDRAFMFKDGVLTHLGTLGDPSAPSRATAINARGQVVGSSNGRAFLYEGGAMRDLGTLGGGSGIANGINDRGQVVGMASNEVAQPTPFLFEGDMRALPGPGYSAAIAINNRAQVVGSAEGTFGYVIEGGTATRLDTLPAVVAMGWRRLEPTGINDRGWIVGTASNADGELRAFLLVPGSVHPAARRVTAR